MHKCIGITKKRRSQHICIRFSYSVASPAFQLSPRPQLQSGVVNRSEDEIWIWSCASTHCAQVYVVLPSQCTELWIVRSNPAIV
jgi:hypothetical protein